MLDSLIVPLFVTTDLPPDADLAEFGVLLAESARAAGHEGAGYDAFLAGKVFWLDRPVLPGQRPPARSESRFAGLLGHVAVSGSGHTPRQVVADVRRAVAAAVTGRYGDMGVAPAVFAIRDRDVRERTPDDAVPVDSRDAAAGLVTAARPRP
ncbi:hypothetical protein [Nonomuraea sp. SBT364]|uniref:hypothetical protein n=1 Tax=Nonomuraea sp. SBT364 TaxID=1580530 RepID=UPI00066AF19C|nr:hypothetical protein [Nonomuraea sp. SBT364]